MAPNSRVHKPVKKVKKSSNYGIIALVGTLITFGAFAAVVLWLGGENGPVEQRKHAEQERKAKEARAKYSKVEQAKIKITDDGLVSKDILVEGTGPQAKKGQRVSVHYTGTLNDGTKFDSSVDRNQPFEFTIGSGVIEGWSLGVASMKVGEKSRFVIGSKYGYGERGAGGAIPGGATLIFEIELLKIL